MSFTEEYKLAPLKKMFSKKIKHTKGIEEREIKLACSLGTIPYYSKDVLLSFWTEVELKIDDSTLRKVLATLERCGIIIKK